MSQPRQPSAELDWSDIASIEETAGEGGEVGAPNVLALCRTIRALCVERDRQAELYIAAVNGRRAFRQAFRDARDGQHDDPTPRELGDTTGDGTDAAHRESEARKLR